jgi:hypothetical protein
VKKISESKSLLIKIFFSIFIGCIFFYLSLDYRVWVNFWHSLSIPAQTPFSDFKAHIYYYECFENGINIYIDKCNLIPEGTSKISTHPTIWLTIVKIFNLQNEFTYNFFLIFIYSIYFYCLTELFFSFDTFKNKVFLIIFFLSTSNFILIERFATDMILFILVYIILSTDKKIIQIFVIFIGILLKYYPIFLTSIFIKNKKILILTSIIYTLFIFVFYIDEVRLISKNILEIALMIAYGSRTIAKSFYHLSSEYGFFINDRNYQFFKNTLILMFGIYSLILILMGHKFNQGNMKNLTNKIENYFVGGASIYVGTFIIGSNFDYRLIFLIFTIPYLMSLKNSKIKYILIICYIFSINSFLLQHSNFLFYSDIKHWIYYLKSFLLFFCKFLIFTFLSYLLGSHLKNINFFSFKK